MRISFEEVIFIRRLLVLTLTKVTKKFIIYVREFLIVSLKHKMKILIESFNDICFKIKNDKKKKTNSL